MLRFESRWARSCRGLRIFVKKGGKSSALNSHRDLAPHARHLLPQQGVLASSLPETVLENLELLRELGFAAVDLGYMSR